MAPSLMQCPIFLSFFATLVAARCSKFTPVATNATYLRSGSEQQISRLVTCDSAMSGGKNCSVGYNPTAIPNTAYLQFIDGGLAQEYSVLNISTSPAVATDLFSTIAAAVNSTFYNPLYSPVNNTGTTLALGNGQPGWIAYTPELDCHVGTLEGCSGDGYPLNGTVVEACSPSLSKNQGAGCKAGSVEYKCLSYSLSMHEATKDEAANATCTACQRLAKPPGKDGSVPISAASPSLLQYSRAAALLTLGCAVFVLV